MKAFYRYVLRAAAGGCAAALAVAVAVAAVTVVIAAVAAAAAVVVTIVIAAAAVVAVAVFAVGGDLPPQGQQHEAVTVKTIAISTAAEQHMTTYTLTAHR